MKVPPKRAFTLCATASLAALAFSVHGSSSAQTKDATVRILSEPESSLVRNQDEGHADSPSGGVRMLLAPLNPAVDALLLSPAIEHGQAPSEPSSSEEVDDDKPTFFGESVAERVLWVLDVSDSMMLPAGYGVEDSGGNAITNAKRLDVVKIETINVLQALDEEASFDFILLAGYSGEGGSGPAMSGPSLPVTDAWQDRLVPCTDENRAAAITYIKNLSTWWGTPTLDALRRTAKYEDELEQLYLLTDGYPVPTKIGNESHIQKILQEFPGIFAGKRDEGCELICIHIGESSVAAEFLQQLAAENKGTYIHR